MLQENRWTGLLFIIGIFAGSWHYGVAAILAAAAGTVAARMLHYNQDHINAGLYGFSAALVGVALAFLFEVNIIIWALIVVGGVLAALLQHFFMIRKIPAYTFPFILVAWGFVFLLRHYTNISAAAPPIPIAATPYDSLMAVTNGFGEVIFQAGKVSGLLFFVAVLISNPAAGLYGLAASLLGAILSLINGQPADQVNLGLFGFNAVLTAIVFSGNKKTDGLWVLTGSVITIVIHNVLVNYHVLDVVGGIFTFPFVAGTWVTLLLQKLFLNKENGV